jgi:putative ABC transport system substrate-binding protein
MTFGSIYAGPDRTLSARKGGARELVAMAPNVIVATSTQTTRVLRGTMQTIPIVFVGLSDPVATGVVSNLARPDENITGFMLYEHSLSGKWLSLLKDMAPQLTHVGVLFNPDTSPYAPFYMQSAQEMGELVGVKVTAADVRHAADVAPAIERIARAGTGGMVVLPDGGFIASNSAEMIALAAKNRVPAIYAVRFYVVNGGLMSYGADLTSQFRDGARYVDRILRGALPQELPVQFATKFDLVINLKTADALGLTIPPVLLSRADEVIE